MFQLKFDEKFNDTIRDIPYWKTYEDIPDKIKSYIIKTSDERVVYEKSTNNFYCGKCLEKLDENNYCHKCKIKHKTFKDNNLTDNKEVTFIEKKLASKLNMLNTCCNYFVFDIKDNLVYLYLLKEYVTYNNPISNLPYKNSRISIDLSLSYFIESDGITNLETNKYISFKYINSCYENFYNEDETSKINDTDFDVMDELFFKLDCDLHEAYLYTDNLNDLKNTIYKYSKIWNMKEYLKEQSMFAIIQFTFNPLYLKQFEYLVNYKLFNLAWYSPTYFSNGNTFKEIFGVAKNYLNFMIDNNITYNELCIMKLYPCKDIELIKFFEDYNWLLNEYVEKYKINLLTLKNYLIKNNLNNNSLNEYFDYIDMAEKLHLNLEDKNILYPTNLLEKHDILYEQIKITEDSEISNKIKNFSNILSINKYEDENYIIYPASSIKELLEESNMQKNCVRTYCEKIANKKSQIYFMRKKENIASSFVTIEVVNKRIVQARTKYNKLPPKEVEEILKKWEKQLIPIENIN